MESSFIQSLMFTGTISYSSYLFASDRLRRSLRRFFLACYLIAVHHSPGLEYHQISSHTPTFTAFLAIFISRHRHALQLIPITHFFMVISIQSVVHPTSNYYYYLYNR